MTRYEFKPNLKKSGRNQTIGTWEESNCKNIDLPFTKESLKTILNWGLNIENSKYTHQEITHWCDRLHMESINYEDVIDEIVIDIAIDVDAQWDLYLVNTYKLEELQKLDFSGVNLPTEWFEDWLKNLNT